MSVFSEMLSFAIKSQNINVNEMIQYCNIDRSTMYQIIRGKRKPASIELVENMATFLGLSPSECRQFINAYEITRIGEEKFYSRRTILQFLLDFNQLKYSSSPKKHQNILLEYSPDKIKSGINICLSQISQISAYIQRILGQESTKSTGNIYIIAQPEHLEKINLSACMLNFNSNVSIQHIICIDNSKTPIKSDPNYNINCFKSILPFFGMQYKYQPYYYYDQVNSHFSSLNLMPCLFLTSTAAVACSGDLKEGIYFSQSDILQSLKNYFINALDSAKPLSIAFSSVLDTFLLDFFSKTTSRTLQYYLASEPCLIRFFDDTILEKYLKSHLPDRKATLNLIKAYIQKQTTFKNFFYFFTRQGLQNFLRTGKLHEIPSDIYEPFDYADRIRLLKKLYDENQSSSRVFLLKNKLGDISDNFNLFSSSSTGYLLFSKYYGSPSLLLIQEPKLIQSFYDFLSTLEESNLTESFEETQKYLKEVIDRSK